jgi:hypothetical protein
VVVARLDGVDADRQAGDGEADTHGLSCLVAPAMALDGVVQGALDVARMACAAIEWNASLRLSSGFM